MSIDCDQRTVILENKQTLKFDRVYSPETRQEQISTELAYPLVD